jgi:hypothetical protein
MLAWVEIPQNPHCGRLEEKQLLLMLNVEKPKPYF